MELFHIDAFAEEPFRGNPAAVVLLERPAPERWMQSVASEMNLSETAFVAPEGRGFSLRWFTPVREAPLCGHATLASAHALWESGRLSGENVAEFSSLSGALEARRSGGEIELELPAIPIREAPLPEPLRSAFPFVPIFCGRTPDRGLGDWEYLLEADSAETVRSCRPDFDALRTFPAAVIVTARASEAPEDGEAHDAVRDPERADIVSRYFAGYWGIDEDPVTGVAHCSLGPYWAARLGSNRLRAEQASPRGGRLGVSIDDARVRLSGGAVTVFRAELLTRP